MLEKSTILKLDDHKIRLTDKVFKAMILIAEYNFVTPDILQAFLGNRNTIFKKLTALEKGGLITNFPTGTIPQKAYCLTARGYHFLQQNNKLHVSRHFKPSEYRQTTLQHTLACIRTQLAFEKHSYVLSYESTKVLNAKKDKIPPLQPDAEFAFKENLTPEAKILRGAAEIELTRKSTDTTGMDRNAKRYLRYDARPEIAVVVWICGSESVRENLQKVLRTIKSTHPETHRFVLYEDVINKGLMDAPVQDYTGHSLSILFEVMERQRDLFALETS